MKTAKKVFRLAALGIVLTATGCIQDGVAKREPGNWKLDRKLVAFEIDGMPPEERSRMVNLMSSNPSEIRCLTQEHIDSEDPLAVLLDRTTGGASKCSWSKMSIVGAAVDVAGACIVGDQALDMTIKGTAIAEKVDVVVTMDGKLPARKVVLSMTDVRTGACAAEAVGGS